LASEGLYRLAVELRPFRAWSKAAHRLGI